MTASSSRGRLARQFSWLAMAALASAALFAPATVHAADAVAPSPNDNACGNVSSGADSALVWLATSGEGLTVHWSIAEPPGGFGTDGTVVVRACVDGAGAWSQNDTNDGAELFPWAVFGLEASPCPGDAVLGGSVDGGEPFVNTQKQNGIACSDEPAPTPTATAGPTATPTPAPTGAVLTASILIAKFDSGGTDDPDDDVLLDGATFTVHQDDGNEAFDPTSDASAFGPAEAGGGLLDTTALPAGAYWIVETETPSGFVAGEPILVELNLDGAISCIWDRSGLIDCEPNDEGAEGLSWTIVLVANDPLAGPTPTVAPTPTPGGAVGGATGTPSTTLPPTDAPMDTQRPSGEGWRAVIIILALILATATLLAPIASRAHSDPRR